ncbi:MAG: alpha/beta hydrolase [Pseudomonadota bacterium]
MLSACTDLQSYLVNLPANLDHVRVAENIAYGDKIAQKLDLYLPRDKGLAKPPLIIFFYGGGWTSGDKDVYKFLAESFIEKNYALAVPNYTLYPDAKFPDFMYDAAKAVSYLYKHHEKYDFDRDNIIIMGHSAGAYIAAMLAADKTYLTSVSTKDIPFRAIIGLSGPYAFTPREEPYTNIFGPPKNYPSMKIPAFVTEDIPPHFLAHGTDDHVVSDKNRIALTKAIRQQEGEVISKQYDDYDHIDTISTFSKFWGDEKLRNDVFEYIQNIMQKAKNEKSN